MNIMYACSGVSQSARPSRTSNLSTFLLVRLLLLSFISLLIQGPHPSSCVPVSEFFTFGTSSDHTTERSDDGGSNRINLTVMFPFFGKRHDKIYVNNNGVITFFDELRTYRPGDFPLKEEIPIIAPYWADVDISTSNGTVWYRETRDQLLLAKATKEIRTFSAYRNFQAYWVFVATWEEVGYFAAINEGLNKRNTFQAVLVLDTTGRQSFVILNYAKIEWTTGSNSRGDMSTGLGGDPAQAGFNAGDGINHFEIEGARTDAVINLTQTSNVGVPGKWIFRVDSVEIQDGCSQAEYGEVYFQPTATSMLGGEPITVIGLCFDTEVPSVEGRLETGDGQMLELCCHMNDMLVQCYLPPVLLTGLVNISLNIDGRGWNYSGHLEIRNVMDFKPVIVRESPESWVPGTLVKVSWAVDFEQEALSYQFAILVYLMQDGLASLQIVSNETHPRQVTRKYQISLPSNLLGANIAVVRVTPVSNNCSNLLGPAIYSDVFPIRYLETSYLRSLCSDWLLVESKQKPLHVPGHCPCTLRQAEGDTAQYTQDPFCSPTSHLSYCHYRSPTASQCIMPNYFLDDGGTFVCCYEQETGELLIALEGAGGGTMERYHFRQTGPGLIPFFTYLQTEISPYLHCCEFSRDNPGCQQYLRVRPPVGCRGYQPPAAAQAAGDPHIVTLDNCAYTFNGLGEFTLLTVQGTQTTVQVRAVPVTNYQNQPQNATVFSAVAMRASNSSPVLEIRLKSQPDQEFVSVYKDSEYFPISSSTSQLPEMTVYKNDSQNGTSEMTVVMVDVGLSILVQATPEMLNIMVMAGSQLRGRLEGLLGNYNGNTTDDFTSSNGTILAANATMREIHYQFGMTWLVPANESLFTVTEFDKNIRDELEGGFYSAVFIDEVHESELPENTDEVCDTNTQCRFDYRVTEKETIAMATLKFHQRYEERKQDISEVVRCPYLGADSIANGTRNLTGLQVGNIAIVECNEGYSMNGSSQLTCGQNGEWNTEPPTCVKITSDESFLVMIAAGSAVCGFVVFLTVAVIVRVTCRQCSSHKITKSASNSEAEHTIELPTLFPVSDIPAPVFENSLFLSSLNKLSNRGSFRIPRPTFVDPNIYSEYF